MPPSLSPELIARLRCPETRQALVLAADDALESVRRACRTPDLEGALIREDGLRAYPIRDGFPILLIDEAIALPTDAAAN